MKYTFRTVVCIIITLCLLMFDAVAVDDGVAKEKEAIIKLASEYVANYLETVLLYNDTDLQNKTILSLDESKRLDDVLFYQGNGNVASFKETCKSLKRYIDIAGFYKFIRKDRSLVRYNLQYDISCIRVDISEVDATVFLYSYTTFSYFPDGEITELGDSYIIGLKKIDDKWYICNIINDEMVADGFEKDFDLQKEIQSYNSVQSMKKDDTMDILSVPQNEDLKSTVTSTDFSRSYNRSNAVAYANTYSSANYTGTTGNNSAYLNSLFYDYSLFGGNCQNFASQAVWAGFGGSNDSASVKPSVFPMDNEGNRTWYDFGASGAGHTGSWTYTDYFRDYVMQSNQGTDKIAMTGTVARVAAGADFTGLSTGFLLGAVVHTSNASSSYSHAIVLTNIQGTTPSTIRYCANSPMRRNDLLANTNFGVYQSMLIVPSTMKRVVNCTGSAHSFPTYSSYNVTTCSHCGFCKLVVTGNQLSPFQTGIATVSGQANQSCYRMALCVTTPAGISTWYSSSNCNSISRTYNFSTPGLYTIKVCARDVPETSPVYSSTNVTTTYTIRVW